MRSRRISYEIVPGSLFPQAKGMRRASFGVRAEAQRQAETLFEKELLIRLGIEQYKIGSEVVHGGWAGKVNPSLQVLFDPKVRQDILRDYAASLGLIWAQDAVAIAFLNPDGASLVARISRTDDKPLTDSQMERFYRLLHEHDSAKQATIGFTEYEGKMVFVNPPGGLDDKRFEETLIELAEKYLPGEVYLDFARADFELQSTDWSSDHGEGYRERLRESKRFDLLTWIETTARPQAEQFIREFPWQGHRQVRRKGHGKARTPRRNDQETGSG